MKSKPPDHFSELINLSVVMAKHLGADYRSTEDAFLRALYRHYPKDVLRLCQLEAFRRLLAQEGGSVEAATAAMLYRPSEPPSPAALRRAVRSRRLIGMRDESNTWRFPAWQFCAGGGVLPGLHEVLETLHREHPVCDEVTVLSFMLGAFPELGTIALQALREGRIDAVKKTAEASGE